jgi:GntR family transcriptional regulator
VSDLPYRTLADNLRGRIRSGEFGPGDILPGNLALAAEHGVSPVTVERAVRALAEEGLVRPVQRRGTVVLDATVRTLGPQRGDGHRLDDRWHVIRQTRVVEPAPQDVAALLVGQPEGFAYRIGGEHVEQLATVWRIPDAGPVTDWAEVVSASLPSPDQARALSIPTKAPIIRVRRIGRCPVGVIEVADCVLPGRYELSYRPDGPFEEKHHVTEG